MTRNNLTDRRRFVRGAGAALVAPLAVGAAAAASRDGADDALHTRVQRLEAAAELRRLHLAYIDHVNAGERAVAARLFANGATVGVDDVARLTPALSELDAGIELSADGATAYVRVRCTAEIATAVDSDCTLAQMARLQGEGVVVRAEACVLESTCTRHDGAWRFVSLRTRMT